jgi:hypothetical protein
MSSNSKPGRVPDLGPLTEGPGSTSSLGSLPAPRVACRCSPAGFDRQQVCNSYIALLLIKYVLMYVHKCFLRPLPPLGAVSAGIDDTLNRWPAIQITHS